MLNDRCIQFQGISITTAIMYSNQYVKPFGVPATPIAAAYSMAVFTWYSTQKEINLLMQITFTVVALVIYALLLFFFFPFRVPMISAIIIISSTQLFRFYIQSSFQFEIIATWWQFNQLNQSVWSLFMPRFMPSFSSHSHAIDHNQLISIATSQFVFGADQNGCCFCVNQSKFVCSVKNWHRFAIRKQNADRVNRVRAAHTTAINWYVAIYLIKRSLLLG